MPSLLEAIKQKYEIGFTFQDVLEVTDEPESSRKSKDVNVAIFVPPQSPRAIVPTLLVLNNLDIETSGSILNTCENVEELDLAGNALSDWNEILKILKSMPKLRFVNLSFNNLTGIIQDCDSKWLKLQNLVLNGTNIPWISVKKLIESCPNLQELHLSFNGYKNVDLNSHVGIKNFHFAGNKIENWYEVCKIGTAFPMLRNLVLASCPIPGPQTGSEQYFPNLYSINLDDTNLKTWEELENLSNFENLQTVRVRCNFDDGHTEYERRMFCIARLPKVTTLNGGPVDSNEREDAERSFIRHYSKIRESDRPKCFGALIATHGILNPLVSLDLTPEKIVNINFIHGSENQIRSVDIYMTVTDLKASLESFCGIPPHKIRLFYLDQDLKGIQGPEEMKYPAKRLYSYNIQSGDEIWIDEKKSWQKATTSNAIK